jgi:hypothetical protein
VPNLQPAGGAINEGTTPPMAGSSDLGAWLAGIAFIKARV